MNELTLDLGPLPSDPAARSLEDRFREFHAANPALYVELVKVARGLKAKGHDRFGIGLCAEVVRWQSMVTTTGDPFKVNNDYRSRYARLIARNEPDLAEVFETRSLRAA